MKKKHVSYHKDGSVWGKGWLEDGLMVGSWTWFRKDGSKMRSGSFEDGKQVGIWTTFDKDGSVVRKTKMK